MTGTVDLKRRRHLVGLVPPEDMAAVQIFKI
jgi:hypothetical protein